MCSWRWIGVVGAKSAVIVLRGSLGIGLSRVWGGKMDKVDIQGGVPSFVIGDTVRVVMGNKHPTHQPATDVGVVSCLLCLAVNCVCWPGPLGDYLSSPCQAVCNWVTCCALELRAGSCSCSHPSCEITALVVQNPVIR